MTLVAMVTTLWSSETPWAVCRVCVTSAALCQRVYVICGPDSAPVERGWREHSVPTVPTTTTTGVLTSRVREHRAEAKVQLLAKLKLFRNFNKLHTHYSLRGKFRVMLHRHILSIITIMSGFLSEEIFSFCCVKPFCCFTALWEKF